MDSGLIHKNKIIRKTATGAGKQLRKGLFGALLICSFCFFGAFAKAEGADLSGKLKFSPAGKLTVRALKEDLKSSKITAEDPKPIDLQRQIDEAAEFAASVTGVRKDFLMGMLVVESDLGRNVGQCRWDKVQHEAENSYGKGLISSRTWQNFQKRKQILGEVAVRLKLDPGEIMVSCSPSNYAGTGGAMGIAQFMPDTWLEYQTRVGRIVGKEIPDPWNVQDAVVAMALKLSDVPGVKDHLAWAEANAAKIYLSGSTSHRFNWYAQKILYWSKNYRRLQA